MAGPIRDLIQMVRERRQQRREDGPGLFPRLRERFGDRMDGERGSGPRIRGMMRMGRGSPSPTEEVEPETLPTPAGEASRLKATSVSTKGAPGTVSGPAPVTGDQNSLPDVLTPEDLDQKILNLSEQIGLAKTPEEAARLTYQIKSLDSVQKRRMVEGQLKQKQEEKSFPYNMDSMSRAAKQAVESGEYSTLESLADKALSRVNSAGEFVQGGRAKVQEIVRPHVRSYVAGLAGSKRWTDMTQDEQFKLHRAIGYAYPVTLTDKTGNTPLPPDKIVKEADRLYARLLADFPTPNEDDRKFLRGLANIQVKQQAAILGIQNLPLNRNP